MIKFPGSYPCYPHFPQIFLDVGGQSRRFRDPGDVSRRDGTFRLATGGVETKGPGGDAMQMSMGIPGS
jgi:hypothetical protein